MPGPTAKEFHKYILGADLDKVQASLQLNPELASLPHLNKSPYQRALKEVSSGRAGVEKAKGTASEATAERVLAKNQQIRELVRDTSIRWAIQHDDITTLDALYKAGDPVTVSFEGGRGGCPIEYARQLGKTEVADWLEGVVDRAFGSLLSTNMPKTLHGEIQKRREKLDVAHAAERANLHNEFLEAAERVTVAAKA